MNWGPHNGRYTLVGQTPVPCEDLLEWGRWFMEERGARRVSLTRVGPHKVSTVFLGLDHSFGGGPPLLFETMVFTEHIQETEETERGPEVVPDFNSDICERCSTWLEAEAQHRRVIDQIKRPGDLIEERPEGSL